MTARRSNNAWIGWLVGAVLVAGALIVALVLTYPLWTDFLFQVTGEESLPAQIRGGLEGLGNVTRRQPETADFVPVANIQHARQMRGDAGIKSVAGRRCARIEVHAAVPLACKLRLSPSPRRAHDGTSSPPLRW